MDERQIPSYQEESHLIESARRGDKDAYRQLVQEHQDRLYRLVLSMVSNREQAEDLTQEIFLKAYFALASFGGQSTFYTWLYRIASNHCLDYFRKRRLVQVSLDRPLNDDSDIRFEETLEAPTSERPDSALAVPSAGSTLLSALDPDQRLILSLRELEGRSYEELSDMLRCPVNTIKSRLNRAREALKAAYLRQYGNISDPKIVLESRGKP